MLMLIRGTITGREHCQMQIKAPEETFTIKYAPEHAPILQNFKINSRVLADIPLLSTEFEYVDSNKNAARFGMAKYSETQNKKAIIYNESIKIYKEKYDCIDALRHDKYTNIIAFCGGFKPLIKTKGTDSMFSLVLKDQTGMVDLKVFIKENNFKIFNGAERLDKIEFNAGEILCLQNIKLGKNSTTALIHRACDIRKILRYKNYAEDENKVYENYVAQYLDGYFKSNFIQDIYNSPKTIRIEQAQQKMFFNVLAKVLYLDDDIFPTICIADFTVNPLNCNVRMDNDCNIVDSTVTNALKTSNGNDLVFPSGMVLVVKLFGKHTELFKKIRKDEYYFFMNIRIHSFAPCMEAYMHDSLEGDVISVKDYKFLREIQNRENKFYSSKSMMRNRTGEDRLNEAKGKALKSDDVCDYNRAAEGDIKMRGSSAVERENALNFNKNHEIWNGTHKLNAKKLDKDPGTGKLDSSQISAKKMCLAAGEQVCLDEKPAYRPSECLKEAISLSKLGQITLPGIYLSKCLIRGFSPFDTDSGAFSIITVEEDGLIFTLTSRLKLTQKLLGLQDQFINKEFKCLVLRNSDKKFFVVDLFLNDEQYSNFENFYLNS